MYKFYDTEKFSIGYPNSLNRFHPNRKVFVQNNIAIVNKLIVLLKDNIVPTYKKNTTIF